MHQAVVKEARKDQPEQVLGNLGHRRLRRAKVNASLAGGIISAARQARTGKNPVRGIQGAEEGVVEGVGCGFACYFGSAGRAYSSFSPSILGLALLQESLGHFQIFGSIDSGAG